MPHFDTKLTHLGRESATQSLVAILRWFVRRQFFKRIEKWS